MRNTLAKIAAVGVLAIGMVFAASPGKQAHRWQQRLDRMAATLNLTESQKEQARAFFDEARSATQPIRQELRGNHRALAEAVKANKSQAEIEELANRQGQLIAKMIAANAMAFGKLYGILTPEQRAQADQLYNRFTSRMSRQR